MGRSAHPRSPRSGRGRPALPWDASELRSRQGLSRGRKFPVRQAGTFVRTTPDARFCRRPSTRGLAPSALTASSAPPFASIVLFADVCFHSGTPCKPMLPSCTSPGTRSR
jgi:hypothetical protein